MAFKFIALAALVACANAGAILPAAYPAALAYKSYAAPALAYAGPVVAKSLDAEYDPHPQYQYSYDVHDSLTGDVKSQHEQRDGDLVQGSYSLLESDGTRRIVDYTADAHNGFNAVVRKEPAHVAVKAIAAAPVAYKSYAAPAIASYAAAPLAYKSYAAPAIASYAAAPLAYKTYAAPAAVAYKSYGAPALAYSSGYYH